MSTDRPLLLRALVSGLMALQAVAHAQTAGSEAGATAPPAANSGPPPPPPPSLTTVGHAQLLQLGITSLDGVAAATPAITLTPSVNSANTPVLYMRGQGLDNPQQITRDGAVGVYEDGFYIGRPQALAFDLLNLDHVDVLPGPQGALYGRNTTGGVVNLVSTAPSGEFHYTQLADLGNRNLFRVLASLDSPEWHGLSAKLTVLASSIDGYVRNPEPDSNDYGAEHQRGGRLQLRWDPFAGLRADYAVERSDLDSTPLYGTNPALNGYTIYSVFFPYYANPNGPTETTYRPVFLPESTSYHVAQRLTLAWQPSAAFAVKSLTGYRTLQANPYLDYAEFTGIIETNDDFYSDHEFSQQLQLLGSFFNEQLSYLIGAEYFKEGGWHEREYDFPSYQLLVDDTVQARTESAAEFLQLHWQPDLLQRRFELSAAGRYTREIKDAVRFDVEPGMTGGDDGAVNRLTYKRFTPSGTLSYHWTDAISTYGTVATGYRSGGALETAPIGQFGTAAETFRPETLLTYEFGVHGAFLGERLRTNVAAFSTRERDVQYQIPVDPIEDQVYTIAQATVRGVDLSLAGTPIRDLTLSATGTYLHTRIDQARVLAGTPLDPASESGSPYTVGESVTGLFVLPDAPKYNFTAAGDYTFLRWYEADLSAHLDYQYRGQFYSDFAAGPLIPGRALDVTPSVGLLDARLTFSTVTDWSHRIKIGLWGRNILNRKYFAYAEGYGSGVSRYQESKSGTVIPAGWLSSAGAWAGPATYGIDLTYEY